MKILVATDFSENAQSAFESAYELACESRAGLYLLHVQDENTLRMAIKEGLLSADSTDDKLAMDVNQLIDMRFSNMVAGLDPSEVSIQRVIAQDNPKTAIVDLADEIHADIVVIGIGGVTAMERLMGALLGSVAEYVVRKSPCPVLLVRPEHGNRK